MQSTIALSGLPPDNLRQPIIGAGVGNGLNAHAATEGGADFLVTYSTAIYRTQGLPSMLSFLPYDNCNRMTLDILPTISSNSGNVPLFAGLGAHDPREDLEHLIEKSFARGAAGVANEPFAGTYGTFIRSALDQAHLGFERELKMLKLCAAKNGLTLGWAFSENECQLLAANGMNYIGLMIEASGTLAPEGIREEICSKCNIIFRENPDAVILLHGKPFENDSLLEAMIRETPVSGYFTGSSLERATVEHAIREKIQYYKTLTIEKEELS